MSEFNKFADLMIEAAYQENIKNLGKPMAELMKQSVIQLKPVIEIFFNKGMEIGKAQAVPDTYTPIVLALESVQSKIAKTSFLTMDEENKNEVMAVDANELAAYIDKLIEAQEPAND